MSKQSEQYTDVLDLTEKTEADRLREVESMADPTTTRWLKELGVGVGWKCLEIGAGAGSIAQWLCQEVGVTGSVVAADLKTELLERLEEPNLEVRRCDLRTEVFEEGAYDLIHGRFVLMHLGEQRNETIRMLHRALRPGGLILVEDADYELFMISLGQVWPKALAILTAGYEIALQLGIDNFFGRRVPAWLEETGFVDVEAEAVAHWMRGPEGFSWLTPAIEAVAKALGETSEFQPEDALRVCDILKSATYRGFGLLQIGAWGRNA